MDTISLSDYQNFSIKAPWGEISGRWYGNRNERPILALHCWLDTFAIFERLLPLLPAHLGVLCIDLPSQYSVLEFARIIRHVVCHFNWTRVSLMGLSLGALISILYIALVSEEVDMIIALDVLKEQFKLPILDYTANSVKTMLKLLQKSDAKLLGEPVAGYNFPAIDFSRFGLILAMIQRIRNIPYLILKSNESNTIEDGLGPMLKLLSQQKSAFEFHTVHLNDPQGMAAYIVKFLSKYWQNMDTKRWMPMMSPKSITSKL